MSTELKDDVLVNYKREKVKYSYLFKLFVWLVHIDMSYYFYSLVKVSVRL